MHNTTAHYAMKNTKEPFTNHKKFNEFTCKSTQNDTNTTERILILQVYYLHTNTILILQVYYLHTNTICLHTNTARHKYN
jgi:hypothetical protein